jgi:hypothetical protein
MIVTSVKGTDQVKGRNNKIVISVKNEHGVLSRVHRIHRNVYVMFRSVRNSSKIAWRHDCHEDDDDDEENNKDVDYDDGG